MSTEQPQDLTPKIGANLPFLRRYARALTGSQVEGDKYAVAALEAILSDTSIFDHEASNKVALFKVFHILINKKFICIPPLEILRRDQCGDIARTFRIIEQSRHGVDHPVRVNALQPSQHVGNRG